MTDYISREVLIEHLRKDPLFDLVERHGITGVINSIPAADVRPVVKARWKPVMCVGNPNIQDRDEWYGPLFVCDKCNWMMIGESNFCPNCGADMREES